ncbi:MAG: hypothetical protein PHQ00_04950 [Phycisphaerae bacterium]|nr:hypothetical protein [Phycisphaerae bacterium]
MNDKVFWLRIIISILQKLFGIKPSPEQETDNAANLKAKAVAILDNPIPKMGNSEYQLLLVLIQILREYLQSRQPKSQLVGYDMSPTDTVEQVGRIRALVLAVPDED